MPVADNRRETLTPRTGVEGVARPEDTAGGRVTAGPKRRDFLKWGLLGSLLLTLGGFGQGFLMFFYPKRVGAFGGRITMPSPASEYPVGSMERVREGKFYLSHVPEGFLALYWRCAHLGCTVPFKESDEFQGEVGIFRCPCHGSTYLRNGQNVAGPAPRPLDIMAIEVEGNKIVVNTGKIKQRTQHEASDATKI